MLEDWNPMSIRELERLHIERMLRHTSGNRGEAARLLGINPTTLWRKMKTYEIS
jgi:DNA-binding NtrC family response regulator